MDPAPISVKPGSFLKLPHRGTDQHLRLRRGRGRSGLAPCSLACCWAGRLVQKHAHLSIAPRRGRSADAGPNSAAAAWRSSRGTAASSWVNLAPIRTRTCAAGLLHMGEPRSSGRRTDPSRECRDNSRERQAGHPVKIFPRLQLTISDKLFLYGKQVLVITSSVKDNAMLIVLCMFLLIVPPIAVAVVGRSG